MRWLALLPSVVGLGFLANTCAAASWSAPGALVSVSVSLDGRPVPLYPAPDGSGRYYLQAIAGSRYEVQLANRTGERVGVVLAVDGLNVISGDRQPDAAPGRMYVLDRWESATVKGWRTNLEEVQRFTFVDERASYAARSGKANGKMGWIEVAVYREHRAYVRRDGLGIDEGRRARDEAPARDRESSGAAEERARPAAPSAQPAPEPANGFEGGDAKAKREGAPAGSYPGTGWGPRTTDHVDVVAFDPEPVPAERLTVRYEYARALRALGILPEPWRDRDRLSERENGTDGFAKPPIW